MTYFPNNPNGQATMANSAPVAIASDQSTLPVSLSGNQPVNQAQVAGTATSVNNGTTDAGTQRVTIASDSTGKITVKLKDASDNSTSVQTVGDAMAAAPTTTLGVAAFNLVYNGTNFVRRRGDTNGAFSIDTPVASMTALTMFRNTALSNTAVAVKASAGRIFNYHIYNPNTADVFVQLYNVAQGSVTVGTTTPDKTLWIPAGGAMDGSWKHSPTFSTAITVAATTTATGGSAPSSGLLVNLDYI